jgi:hypothetical protein
VHALRNIHAALAPGGILVDTQPVSAHPPIAGGGAQLGILDMREWAETIRSVDERVAETIAAGLYELRHEEQFTVIDSFDTGAECVETVSDWRGTHVPRTLSQRLLAATPPVTVEQQVRLRLLRAHVEEKFPRPRSASSSRSPASGGSDRAEVRGRKDPLCGRPEIRVVRSLA